MTHWCPRFKKNIAFCNEPLSPDEAFKAGHKSYPVACKYGHHEDCKYKEKGGDNG